MDIVIFFALVVVALIGLSYLANIYAKKSAYLDLDSATNVDEVFNDIPEVSDMAGMQSIAAVSKTPSVKKPARKPAPKKSAKKETPSKSTSKGSGKKASKPAAKKDNTKLTKKSTKKSK